MKIIVTTKEELEELISSSVRKGLDEYFLEQESKKRKAPHTTIKEASKQLKVSEQTIRNYVKRGVIKANKVGRRILIETTSIDKALSEVKSLKYKRD